MSQTAITRLMMTGALVLLLSVIDLPLRAQSYRINFNLNMQGEQERQRVGVRGNLPPLSWEKTFFLQDQDQDGIYTGSLVLETEQAALQYKFVKNNEEYELYGDDNRRLALDQSTLTVEETFNLLRPLSAAELEQIRFTPDEIREDVAILKRALRTVHPNLYRYIDSLELEAAYTDLEQKLTTEPDLPSAYKYITQLIARIQCSHTITNPWNQPRLIKRALYFQADRVPFTFRILDDRMFIDRNASEEERLRRGTEVLAINDVPVREIFTRLLPYISADGGNDSKRRHQLQLGGAEKFEAFDIIYPLEFPVGRQLSLQLRDHESDTKFSATVSTLAKSERTAILQERYQDLQVSVDDLWEFRILSEQAAYLRLGTFAIWDMEMNWQQFLRDAFDQLNERQIPNLIIDIRDNEGGMDEVYQFVLQRLLREPLQYETKPSKVAYRHIPDDLRPYLGTWDKAYFDLGKQVEPQADGYFLEKIKGNNSVTFKPRKDGYRGEVFLITNAANSSATHLMATLVKQHGLATIVGRTTGGNQRGLNGGAMFFTTLPNTQIEVDIPIFGQYTPAGTPDGGIQPDISVEITVEDLLNGTDPDLEIILQRIAKGQ